MANTDTALHIAVGVLVREDGQVLIAQRRAGTPGAGKWEFPGGKREAGESIETALARELDEEIGVSVRELRPMLRFHHDYSDRRVLLDIWQVTHWQGEAHGREGQQLAWCPPNQLADYDLLGANKPIVDALRLPHTYMITPEPNDIGNFLERLQQAVTAGIRLVRLRAWSLDNAAYEALADRVQQQIAPLGASLMLDRDAALVARTGAAGLHLPARSLDTLDTRPVPVGQWFAVSCHTREQLLHARMLGADFAVLSPVHATPSHPERERLGWRGFAEAREDIAMPVYALGGLSEQEMAEARAHRAQGIAGIRTYWPG